MGERRGCARDPSRVHPVRRRGVEPGIRLAGAASGAAWSGTVPADDGAVRALRGDARPDHLGTRRGRRAGMAIIPPLARGRARPGAVVWSSTRGAPPRERARAGGRTKTPRERRSSSTSRTRTTPRTVTVCRAETTTRSDEGRTKTPRERRVGRRNLGDENVRGRLRRRGKTVASSRRGRARSAPRRGWCPCRAGRWCTARRRHARRRRCRAGAEAEGAERFAEPAREDAATWTRATRMLHALVANGSSPAPAPRGETNAETATPSATSSATSARLARARGEGCPTSHELARAAAPRAAKAGA